MKTIAIVQHAPHDGPGYFGTWLQAQGLAFKVYRMFKGDALPQHASAHDAPALEFGVRALHDGRRAAESAFRHATAERRLGEAARANQGFGA